MGMSKKTIAGLTLAGLASMYIFKGSDKQDPSLSMPSVTIGTLEDTAKFGISYSPDPSGKNLRIDVNPQDDRSGIGRIVLYQDGVEIATAQKPRVSFTLTYKVTGNYSYQIIVYDNAGNALLTNMKPNPFSFSPRRS